MRLLITGVCGFVGCSLANALVKRFANCEIAGIDNLSRPGSESNLKRLAAVGVRVFHGDLRLQSDVDALPSSDWVIDAAANPSVLAGIDGRSSPRQLAEHNLVGTLNVLEYCRNYKSGVVLLSSSRVYSVRDLVSLPIRVENSAFQLDVGKQLCGVSDAGISESFSVRQPVSLYGATKLSSECMAVEYGAAFGLPVWVNRCGVLAGAGQFGTAEQGIFSYWLHAHAARSPLRYIGFGGHGYQVRDALHPEDLADLLTIQLQQDPPKDPIFNVGGGPTNAMSLAQLTEWCDERFGQHVPQPDDRSRPFDVPWLIMNSGRCARELNWTPKRALLTILDEIATHVEHNPGWLTQFRTI
jgi:CDP-paratose 2-epimerase